jgi:hypothetical protein
MAAPPKPALQRIHLKTTPSPDDPPNANEFYLALGVATVAWGRLEGHFNACLMTAIQIAKDKRLGMKLPTRWEKRAKVWKDAFELIPTLQPRQKDAIALLDGINDLAEVHNVMVHAIWDSFLPRTQLTIRIIGIKAKTRKPDSGEFRRTTISMEELAEFTGRANSLNLRLSPIHQFLVALLSGVQKS